MKYILTILLAAGFFSMASAQINYPNDDYGKRRNNGWHFQIFGSNNGYPDGGIDGINHYYDQKVWEIQNDFTLRPREKRRIIREINEERKYRLKAERRKERHWDDDDD